jgi:hypothetical protein
LSPFIVARLEELASVVEQIFGVGNLIANSITIGSHSLRGMVIALIATSHLEGSLATLGALGIMGVLICSLIMVGSHEILAKGIGLVALSLVGVSITREQEEAEKQ